MVLHGGGPGGGPGGEEISEGTEWDNEAMKRRVLVRSKNKLNFRVDETIEASS